MGCDTYQLQAADRLQRMPVGTLLSAYQQRILLKDIDLATDHFSRSSDDVECLLGAVLDNEGKVTADGAHYLRQLGHALTLDPVAGLVHIRVCGIPGLGDVS